MPMPDYTMDTRKIREALAAVAACVRSAAGPLPPMTLAEVLAMPEAPDEPTPALGERDARLVLWALDAAGRAETLPVHSGDAGQLLGATGLPGTPSGD